MTGTFNAYGDDIDSSGKLDFFEVKGIEGIDCARPTKTIKDLKKDEECRFGSRLLLEGTDKNSDGDLSESEITNEIKQCKLNQTLILKDPNCDALLIQAYDLNNNNKGGSRYAVRKIPERPRRFFKLHQKAKNTGYRIFSKWCKITRNCHLV